MTSGPLTPMRACSDTDDAAAAGRDNAATAKRAGATADQGDDSYTREPRFDDGIDGFRDCEFARIGLLQPHAAGIEQQQHGTWTVRASTFARGAQQTNKFCAVHLAERAAEEAPLLRGDEDQIALEPAAADDQPIVERAGQVELREVRAHDALLGPDEFLETSRIEQSRDTVARRSLVPIRLMRIEEAAHCEASISRAPCISRSVDHIRTRTAIVDRKAKAPGRAPCKEVFDHRLPQITKPGDCGRDFDQTFTIGQHALDQDLEVAGCVDADNRLAPRSGSAPCGHAADLELLHAPSYQFLNLEGG